MNDLWWDFIYPGYGLVEFRYIWPLDGKPIDQEWTDDPATYEADRFPHIDGGIDIYYGVIPRKDRGGKAEDCWPTTTVLWADVDAKAFSPDIGPLDEHGGYKPRALDSILKFPVTPSAIVDSGHGYHCYWKLVEPVDFPDAQQVMKGIAKWIRADACYDQPRILRVPGTTNWKDPQNPVPVRLLKLDSLRKYQLSDFDEVVQSLEAHVIREFHQTERREDAPDWLKELVVTEPPKGTRSEEEFHVGIWLARYGYTDDQILDLLMTMPFGAKAQERGERWAEQEVARIRRKA